MPAQRAVSLMLVGLGNVGSVLLRQIVDTRDIVARRRGLHLTITALADISGVASEAGGFSDSALETVLSAVEQRRVLAEALPGAVRPVSELPTLFQAGAVLVDATAAKDSCPLLLQALAAGCGVVTSNKNPFVGSWDTTRALFESPWLRYECTVGAGLPVIRTLQSLLDTGDQATQIEGCMSGTLGYLCAELERGVTYSQVITEARALGYTEPDPRDDLSGYDVARKALILARTAGWPLEMSDLVVEPLYPKELAGIPVAEFMAAASSLDGDYAERFRQAEANGSPWRHTVQVGPQGGMVGLQMVPQDGPLGILRGPANRIAFHTGRYDALPMVISGPGAGPVVTAAGLLGDIVELASLLA